MATLTGQEQADSIAELDALIARIGQLKDAIATGAPIRALIADQSLAAEAANTFVNIAFRAGT